jgi:hypothetical protein
MKFMSFFNVLLLTGFVRVRFRRLVCLKIDQATRAGNRRMIGRRFRQHQPEKLAQGKRIGRPPGNRPLGVETFEIADQ